MNCPKCGAPLDEDSVFCESCGAYLKDTVTAEQENIPSEETGEKNIHTEKLNEKPLEDTVKEQKPQYAANMEKKSIDISLPEANGKNKKLIGLIVGTFFIIVGITYICSSGSHIYSTTFGGDFYTYTYKGIVEISETLAHIKTALGWVIAAIGAAIDVYVIFK